MNFKKIVIFLLIIVIAIVFFVIYFNKSSAKKMKIGNNSSSQEIIDYVLNISSYETKIEVNVESNKNNNKYILKQQYNKPDLSIRRGYRTFKYSRSKNYKAR